MESFRDPSGLRVIEALAPQLSRYACAVGSDYFSDRKRKLEQYFRAKPYATDYDRLWRDIFGYGPREDAPEALPAKQPPERRED
jgi:hypothetical protein